MNISERKWGETWKECFPFGNGHLGAMVSLNPFKEQIYLSHNTFYSGEPGVLANQEGAPRSFALMREKVRAGEYSQAEEIQKNFIGRRENYGTNLPVGKIVFEREGSTEFQQEDCGAAGHFPEQNIKSQLRYERVLQLEEGIGSAVYEMEGVHSKTECFASHPQNAFFYKTEVKGKRENFSIRFVPGSCEGESVGLNNGIFFHTRALEAMHSDGKTGVRLAGGVRVWTDGICRENICTTGISKWEIKDAGWVILKITMDTDYGRDGLNFMEISSAVKNGIVREEMPDYSQWKKEHVRDFKHYMERSFLELETSDNCGEKIACMYQYGRYLLLSSSREDSVLPAHLQGVWNDNVACCIGWTCDMHLDINTQMNYWPAEVTGLSVCALPLFRWIEEDLVKSGEITAKESYGREGWVAELVSNAWAYTAPYWDCPISPCPTGGLWAATHLWEHYLFTGDREFLEKRVFPVVSKAVDFFRAYVFWDEREEMYLTGPSISPENSFTGADGKVHYMETGCTYEVLMVRELYHIFLKSCEISGLTDCRIGQVSEQKEKLPPYPVNRDGTLGEWQQEHKETDVQHRHTSHLLGVYPFCQITPEGTPELAVAARRSIEKKLTPEENWEDTGWSRALLLLYSARLRDGELAYRHICTMLKKLKASNHMIIHPSTRGASAFDDVFEMDGNTGLTAGIAEMLIQSQGETVHILPALPSAWIKGRVCGLRARGGLQVDISWNDRGTEVKVQAELDFEGWLRYHNEKEKISIAAGQTKVYTYLP